MTTCKRPRISGVHKELRCSSELFLCFLSLSNKSCCQMWAPTSSITLLQESVIKSTSSCNDFCMKAATFQNRWRCGRIALKSSASNSRTAPLNSVQIVSCHRSWMARCPERKLDKQKLGDIIPDTLSAFEPWNSRLPLHMGHPRTECSAKSHKTPLISSGWIRSCKRQGLCFKEPSYEFLDKIQI